jgi:hypothetical protein
MKVTLDISFRDFAEFAGIKYVTAFRLFKDGRFHELETAFETKVKQMRNKGETVLKCKSVTISDKAFENETNVKQTCNKGETLKEQETKETLSPTPPIKENKEKEKGGLTPTLSSENIKFSFGESLPFGNDKNFVKETEKVKKPETQKTERKIFIPPTVQEVQDYINLKGYNIDAEQFCAFYESKGWMVGSNKMKNWQMALVTWRRRTEAERKQNSYSYGYNRTNPWSNRRTAPVIASSAKDYEGRF